MNPLVERLGWVLVHSLWQFALVALLAGVIVRTMRRSSAATRYGVLAVAMAVSVAAPVETWMLQPNNAPPDNSVSRRTSVVGQDANAAISSKADETRLASNPILATDSEREVPTLDHATPSVASEALPAVSLSTPAVVHSLPSWSELAKAILQLWLAWIVVLWSLGVLMCSLRPLLGWHTLRRLRRVGVSPASDDVLLTMRRVSERLGLCCTVRVLQSTLAQVPVVVGYMRPMILLPVSLVTSIPAAQLEAILAHELAHVQRHDFVVNLLQTVVETLFFYHPAVWWLSHQIRIEREHCCDDIVVRMLGNRVEYGRALLAIEELRGRRTVLALGVADGSLLSRVRRIVGLHSEHTAISLAECLPAALLGIALIGISSVLSMTWNLAAKDAAMTEPATLSATLPNELGLGQRLELVQWSHDSKQVFATGSFDTFVLWRRKGVEWVPTSLGADHHLNSITASRKSPLIVVGTNVGTAEVWDAINRKRQCEMRCGPENSVYAVAISLDENLVAACGTDGTVAVFNRASQQLITRLGEKAGSSMVSLAFSPDRKSLAAMNRHGQIVLWSVAERTRLAEWKGIAGGDDCSVQWSPDGKQLAVSGWARVTLITAVNGSQPRVIWAPEEVLSRYPKGDGSPHSGPFPGGIRFSSVTAIAPDVRTVASITPDRSIGIWDLATRQIVQKLPAPAENVLVKDGKGPGLRNLVFSPDGRRLACSTEQGDVVFWRLAQAADDKPDGLGAAERSLHSELSYYRGFSPFRLKQFPQAGDAGRSVRLLDPLVSYLPEKVQTDAGRRFNSALQAIAVGGPERIEASIDRIISDTRELPAVHRSALMFNLWIYANDLKATDGLQKLWGLDVVLLDRVKNKCIMAALEQAEEIPDGLTLRFLELSTYSLPSLNTVNDAEWPAKRRMMAELWLTRIEKIRAVIDPHWNPDDRPMINIEVPEGLPMGTSPKGIHDKKLLADYEARLEENRRKTERYNQQLEVHRLLAELSRRMEEDLVRLYVRQPFHPAELELLLDQHAADTSHRDQVAKSVRLVNAILPNGTQLKYGWPDALAEAGPAGVPLLMAAVGDKTYPKFIRDDGAWALGLIGDPRAIDTLTAVAEDETTPDKYKDIARGFVRAMKEGAETTKNESAEIDPVKELASFQGTWCWDFSQPWTWPQPIGVGTDGDGRKSEKRWVIDGNQITWVGRDGQRVYVTFTIDPSKTPKQIDFTFLNGPRRGQKSIGIYESRGDADHRELCMTDPGTDAPRPTDFSAGSLLKQSIIVVYRVAPPVKPSAANELKRLQGVWQMQLCDSTLQTFGGTQQEASKWQWTIKDDEILWSRQGDVWKLRLHVDPSKKPSGMDLTYVTGPFEMDLTYLTGPFKDAKCGGIYGWGGVDGQSLMIAIQDPGSDAPRPTKFHMNSAMKTGLMILRPSKPSDAERELAALQGTWTLRNFDTGNFSRNKDPSSWPLPGGKGPDKSGEASELRWVVKQNEITWTSPSGREIKASFTIDPFQTPKRIDLTFISGPHKGETYPGIYQRGDLDENILWLCLADPGSKNVRPKEFSYQWGEGRSLLSLYPFRPSDAR